MIPKEFSEFFTACDQIQQQKIVDELLLISMQNDSLSDSSDIVVLKCPHCQSKSIRANGKVKGMQRYVCKGCCKNFSQSTGKFWFALKKRDLMIKYLHCLISGHSIRKSAGITGISIQTSFDWRHKLLTSFKTVLPDGFRGIVEMNDVFFAYSEKGKRRAEKSEKVQMESKIEAQNNQKNIVVIAACDRSGTEDLRVITRGNIAKEDIINTLKGRILKAEVLVINDRQNHIPTIDKIKLDLKNPVTNNRRKKAEAIYHIRNVDNMFNRLIRFMSPFHGVATKYLQNYMNWFLVLERIKDSTKKVSTVSHLALSTDRAWYDYKNRNINIYFRT